MTDEDFYQHAFDVARNLVAYGRYGGARDRALGALRRRTKKARDRDACGEALDLLSAVVRTAREAVKRHVVRPADATGYASFEDIDFEACMAEVDAHEPGVALHAKRAAVSWAILYGYLM